MARDKLTWNNVSANANAGTSSMVSGSQMLAGALKSLRAPLDRANQITEMNAKSQTAANTGAYKDAILRGEDPELTGMYDSGTVADTKYAYLKDERTYKMAQDRLALTQAAAGRAARKDQEDRDQNAAATASLKAMMSGDDGVPATGAVDDTSNMADFATREAPVVEPDPTVDPAYYSKQENLNPDGQGVSAFSVPTPTLDPITANEPALNPDAAEAVGLDKDTPVSAFVSDPKVASRVNGIANYLGTDPEGTEVAKENYRNSLGIASTYKTPAAKLKAAQIAKSNYDKELRVGKANLDKKTTGMKASRQAFDTLVKVSGVEDAKVYENPTTERQVEINKNLTALNAMSDDGVIEPQELKNAGVFTTALKSLRAEESKDNVNIITKMMDNINVSNDGTVTPGNEKSGKISEAIQKITNEKEAYKATAGDDVTIDARVEEINTKYNSMNGIERWLDNSDYKQDKGRVKVEHERNSVNLSDKAFMSPTEKKAKQSAADKQRDTDMAVVEEKYAYLKLTTKEQLIQKAVDKFDKKVATQEKLLSVAQNKEKAEAIKLRKTIKNGSSNVLKSAIDKHTMAAREAAKEVPGATENDITKASKASFMAALDTAKVNRAERVKATKAFDDAEKKRKATLQGKIKMEGIKQQNRKDIALFKDKL